MPGPAAPEPVAAPSACSSARVSAPGVGFPAGGASAPSSSGQQEHSRESSCSEWRCRRSSSKKRSQSGKKRCGGLCSFPAHPSRLARSSASSSSVSSGAGEQESAMPSHAGGGRSGRDRSDSGRDRSPRPGPSGLGLGLRSLPVTELSHPKYGGRSSLSPSGARDDNHSSTVNSLDMDRDDSFQAVLRLIRESHSLEEPASVDPNQCKTSFALVYGLQSESSPALHLLTSPLLQSLLEDTNSALSKFVEDRTVHGFLPVPGCRHRRYYRTSSSFPGLFSVPPSLTSITLERVSEPRKRSVSLSHSQVSSLETMLSSVCEVTSWLDWWLSTCGSFREHLTNETRGSFEWLMLFGSRALEFLGGQGITALGNLVLSRRDSPLLDGKSMMLAEEVARLHYAALVIRSFSHTLARVCSGQDACGFE